MLDQPRRERMLNVPAVVVGLLAVLALVHAVSALLTTDQYETFLLLFSFIPARYDASVTADVAWPGGVGADIWTFVSYAFLHANLTHLVVNGVWLLAFCAPLARRFGAARFLAFMAATAAAGALAHLVTHFGALVPIVGGGDGVRISARRPAWSGARQRGRLSCAGALAGRVSA
jgi:membrane associated rhomboid family serine protease